MNRWLKDLDTAIRQWLSNYCETRMFKAQDRKDIKREIFWHNLGIKILGL